MRYFIKSKLNPFFWLSILIVAFFLISGCHGSPAEDAKEKVSSYIKSIVKNPSSYKPIFFSSLDTLSDYLKIDKKSHDVVVDIEPDYRYVIRHTYEIENSSREKVKMSAYFHFDSTLKIISSSPSGLDGNYGQLTGNVYWKYNDYVGNKPDAGSTIELYSFDSVRKERRWETNSDVAGNFRFERLLPGSYLLIVTSKNTTNSPEGHLEQLILNGYSLLEVFGYDLFKSNESELKEYNRVDSLFKQVLFAEDKEYGGFTKRYNTYRKFEEQKNQLAAKIINNLPNDFKTKLGLYTIYSNKQKIETIWIDEGKTANKIVDFGVTYF